MEKTFLPWTLVVLLTGWSLGGGRMLKDFCDGLLSQPAAEEELSKKILLEGKTITRQDGTSIKLPDRWVTKEQALQEQMLQQSFDSQAQEPTTDKPVVDKVKLAATAFAMGQPLTAAQTFDLFEHGDPQATLKNAIASCNQNEECLQRVMLNAQLEDISARLDAIDSRLR